MGSVMTWTDRAEPGERQAFEMLEAKPPLTAAGLDLDMAASSALEWELLTITAESLLIE